MPPNNKASSAVPLADLSTMNQSELTEVAEASLERNLKQKNKIDELLDERQALAVGDPFPLDEFAASIGGGVVSGLVMGSIQHEIDAGTEGYDDDSLKLGGLVDYDLALGVGAAIGSYVVHKSGARKERQAPGAGKDSLKFARILRGVATGAASGAAYRLAYSAAVASDEDDDEETESNGDDQAAV